MIARDQVFSDTKVYLDGAAFHNCTFERCEIVISGFIGCNLNNPRFIDCRWTVAGPAQNTFELLGALYKAGAVDLIEKTFDSIRGRPA